MDKFRNAGGRTPRPAFDAQIIGHVYTTGQKMVTEYGTHAPHTATRGDVLPLGTGPKSARRW